MSSLNFDSKSSFFTSESVSEGHPDKVADQISDAILDELLTFDPGARVACETLCKSGLVVIAGEISTHGPTVLKNEEKLGRKMRSYSEIARQTIQNIGYDDPSSGFDYRSCGIIVSIDEQSPDIAQGVNAGEGLYHSQGAGDQGMMFGYAVDETPEFMPSTLQYSHALLKNLARLRKEGVVDWLRPDAKSQVTVEYRNGVVHRVDAVVLSTMHTEAVSLEEIREFIVENLIKKTIPNHLIDERTKYYINPTGKFVVGGPRSDCGLTGRKVIVDSYGGHGAHGGGAFSGKDPTKVDRSAAYMGRYIAKNIVAAGLAKRALVQIAYAIGVAEPVSVHVNTFGTAQVAESDIEKAVVENFDLTPAGIINALDLMHPDRNGYSYRETAAYGHFGRVQFPWERTDRIKALQNSVNFSNI